MNFIEIIKQKTVQSILLLSALSISFTACKKDEKKDEYKVKYTVECNGRFKNDAPKFVYKNASGTEMTETVTINKAWIKEVSGSSSFPISAKVTGTIDSASVKIEVEGYKNGTLVEVGNHSQSSSLESAITVKYESTFE